MNTPEFYIQEAIDVAESSIGEGGLPFSVVVVDKNTGEIVHRDHDRVKEYMDPTAHAEINAIRYLCKNLNKLSLENYIFYTSSEPCPTCLTACIKAHIPLIYYGAETEENASLPIKAYEIAKKSHKYPIRVIGGILGEKCLAQRENFFNQ